MSRKPIENLEDKIIHATISFGGTNDANRDFSTKDIAKACGVSEFTIYSHFKNKDQLMIAADHAVYHKIVGEAKLLANHPIFFHDFVNLFMDWLISHPELTFFALNYGHGVPHVVPIKDNHKVHQQEIALDARVFLNHFDIHDDDVFVLVWAYMLRHLLYFASHLLNFPALDTPKERQRMEEIINHGLESFAEVEENDHD